MDFGSSSCLMGTYGSGDNNNHHEILQHFHHDQLIEDQNNNNPSRKNGNSSGGSSSSSVKAKIMAHPHYSRLFAAYISCQKVWILASN